MAVRRRRHRGGDHDDGGGGGHGGSSGRWLVSYSDFITLMFVVFLVLFSMARIDAARYGSLAKSLRQSLGPAGPDIPPLPARGQAGQAMPIEGPEKPGNLPDTPDWPAHLIAPPPTTERAPVPPKDPPPTSAKPSEKPNDPVVPRDRPAPPPKDAMSDLQNVFQGLPGARSGVFSVTLQERGLVLTIAGSVLFEPGKTTLKPEAQRYLAEIAGQLKGIELPIMVEGTAVGLGTAEGLTSWDLAALRAGAVVSYFVANQGLPGSQFVTIGHGRESGSDTQDKVTIVVMRKGN